MLLWKALDENDAFLSYVLRSIELHRIVVPLLYFMYDGRKDPAKVSSPAPPDRV